MVYEDFIKREIDRLGLAIKNLIVKILNLRNDPPLVFEAIDKFVIDNLDININEIISLTNDKFKDWLKSEKRLNNSNLDQFTELLLVVAENSDETNVRKSLYEKCLIIYEFLNKNEDVYSWERHLKEEDVNNKLSVL
ncbi:MAG: hypothetical protein LBP67_10110 [Bacteroidales bacterium]|jgi:hypothetical protein|nr:hypothetical protein [Bacteroidales bacterium]